jgi:hypothetical protein
MKDEETQTEPIDKEKGKTDRQRQRQKWWLEVMAEQSHAWRRRETVSQRTLCIKKI